MSSDASQGGYAYFRLFHANSYSERTFVSPGVNRILNGTPYMTSFRLVGRLDPSTRPVSPNPTRVPWDPSFK